MSVEDFYDGTGVSVKDWIAGLEEQAKAQQDWRCNVLRITGQIRDEMSAEIAASAHLMVDELAGAGAEGAVMLAVFADASPKERERLVRVWTGTGDNLQSGGSPS